MKRDYFLAPVIWGIILLTFPGVLTAQNNGNDEFEPTPGQAGKDVIWYPTSMALVDSMIEMANLTPDDYLIDLGSGDGRIVIAAAQRGIRSAGVEYNPDMVEYSRKNAAEAGVADKTEFIEADLFEYDLSDATVITMFLLPDINRRLRPKLLELNPGTRIITNSFTMQEWPYDEMKRIDDESITWNIAYLWIVPAKVEGTWKTDEGELELTQNFQVVSGTLTKDGTEYSISNGRLEGDVLYFTCDGMYYRCEVTGDSMTGTVARNGRSTEWEAVKEM